jgi:hypothetical protein
MTGMKRAAGFREGCERGDGKSVVLGLLAED